MNPKPDRTDNFYLQSTLEITPSPLDLTPSRLEITPKALELVIVKSFRLTGKAKGAYMVG